MKLIIAGGRDYQFTSADTALLDSLLVTRPQINEVVEGGATGADRCGREWAESHGIKVTTFEADWNRYGKRAGMIRNGEMADYGDLLVLFPGGRGSANMRKQARAASIPIIEGGGTLL